VHTQTGLLNQPSFLESHPDGPLPPNKNLRSCFKRLYAHALGVIQPPVSNHSVELRVQS